MSVTFPALKLILTGSKYYLVQKINPNFFKKSLKKPLKNRFAGYFFTVEPIFFGFSHISVTLPVAYQCLIVAGGVSGVTRATNAHRCQ